MGEEQDKDGRGREEVEGTEPAFDVEAAFLRVVQTMNLTSLETAALRLSIARNDAAIKDALDLFRVTQREDQLMDRLRAVARATIEDTLEEADYSMTPAEEGTSVALDSVLPFF